MICFLVREVLMADEKDKIAQSLEEQSKVRIVRMIEINRSKADKEKRTQEQENQRIFELLNQDKKEEKKEEEEKGEIVFLVGEFVNGNLVAYSIGKGGLSSDFYEVDPNLKISPEAFSKDFHDMGDSSKSADDLIERFNNKYNPNKLEPKSRPEVCDAVNAKYANRLPKAAGPQMKLSSMPGSIPSINTASITAAKQSSTENANETPANQQNNTKTWPPKPEPK